MTSSDAAGRILLLGASGVGKHSLLQAIRGVESARQPDAAYPWRLDTKYYTAEVVFDVRHVEQCSQLQLDSAGYEAVLLVFDASQQASFDSLQRWFEAAGGSDADMGVRLAVATRADSLPRSADGEPAKPCWLLEAEEWCAEQLVEYVETGIEQQQQEAGRAPTSSIGATGVQRIREALEAHMWPGLQLKPSPRHGALQGASASQAGAEQEVEDAVLAPARNASSDAPPTSEGCLSFAEYIRNPEEAIAAAGMTGAPSNQEEAEVEQLEQLFAKVASHRAQLAQLPDAQRREAAAAMVMQLMAAMGLEEDDEEQES